MKPDTRKRHVVSYERMSDELAAIFNETFPTTQAVLDSVVKYPKPDGSSFYAVTLDLEDAIYLVKIDVKVDDAEDLQKWLDGESAAEAEQMAGATDTPQESSEALPDDNISQYGSDDDASDA